MSIGLCLLNAHQSLHVWLTVLGTLTSLWISSGLSKTSMIIPKLRCHAMWQWKG